MEEPQGIKKMDSEGNLMGGNEIELSPKGPVGVGVEAQVTPLAIEKYFTKHGKDLFEFDIYGNPLTWVSEEVSVSDDRGKIIFKQPDVKKPDSWSSLALKVVASKYFWGDQAKGERENSVKQLIGRVTRWIGKQALEQNYFNAEQSNILEKEVAALCLNQMCAFNSPVWFNVGIQEYDAYAGGVSAFVWDKDTDSIIPAAKTMNRPQCSACFIQGMTDDMESILAVQVAEATLFKAGSGTGTNRSTLRSSKEKLTGGGKPSGPVSFMKGYDAYAGIIKSGGKTRRAAKMEILNIDHPDIVEFIESKQREEKKAWALIEQGYDGGMNGEAYNSVAFQNCNMSVRAQDEFMEAVKIDGEWETKAVITKEGIETLKAKELLNKIAEGTHVCGDPGMQFDSVINKYHTCKNSGKINASNPCVTGDTKVLTKDGRWKRIDSFIGEKTSILTNTGFIQESEIKGSFKTGKKPVYRLTTKSGYEIKLTSDHKVFTINRGFVQACELTKDDYVLLPAQEVSHINDIENKEFYQILGVYLGDGCGGKISKNRGIQITMDKEKEFPILEKFADYVASNYERMTHKNSPASVQITNKSGKYVITNNSLINKIKEYVDLSLLAEQKCLSDAVFNLNLEEQKYILQGLFTADGTVANYGEKSQYVALDSTSLQLLKDVQVLLLGFGIKSKLYTNRRAGRDIALLPDGKGGRKEYKVKEMHSLRISRSSRIKFERLIGFMPESYKNEKLKKLNQNKGTYEDKPIDPVISLEYLGEEEVYDLTEPLTHTFVANGITIHNCSEYMFLDDSACNLASINLMKFRTPEGTFDVEKLKKAVKYIAISMDLIVDGASYPAEKIARNSRDFRPLGLGYANLGALLMSLGLPYDSDEGRAVAAAITAIVCGEAYRVSAELASLVGPFPQYKENEGSMLEVIKMHRDHVKDIEVNKMPSDLRYLVNDAWDCWSSAYELGKVHGFRNSQMTVLAPTGCLVGNSLVSTDKGLVRLTNLGNPRGNQWQNASFKVMTDEGPKTATKFYINGEAKTRKIRTASGYEIQGTDKHKIKILNPETNKLMWKRFDEIEEGDVIPLAMNTVFGDEQEVLLPLKPELHWNSDFEFETPKIMDDKLAELIGYFMGDGSLHSKGLRFCVTESDSDVAERLSLLVKELFNLETTVSKRKGYYEVSVNSVPLTIWWDACGFSKKRPSPEHKGKGYVPYIPDAILHTNNRNVYAAFLKGLFEADGTVSSGAPSFCTSNKEFSNEVKTLLLSLGYPTRTKIDYSEWGKKKLYVTRLKNYSYNKEFMDNIGFMGIRKSKSIVSVSTQTAKNDRVYLSEDVIDDVVPVGSKERDSILLSIRRHNAIPRERALKIYQDTKHPQLLWALQFFYDRIESNIDGGIQPTYDISVPENVTYTANGFISHNTIGFMMDCDTTGIEPDIALVKYKVLAGGGMLKIVNRSVDLALRKLGYDEEQIKEIISYVDEHDMIEGAPHLNEEHLAIFDCAFKPAKGKRAVHYKGHIKMMGVTQPFISGAISKTINMPESSTVNDIADAYVFAWEQGLKAVAIYRENSKRSQPLNTQKTEGEMVKKEQATVTRHQRVKLPQTRKSITHKFEIAGHEGYLTVGLYDNGKPGEIFVTMHKTGSTIRGLMDAWANSISFNLQYGIPIEFLFKKFRHQKFEPAGFVKNVDPGMLDDRGIKIRTASSIVDYVSQFMLNSFGEGAGKLDFAVEPLKTLEEQTDLSDFQKEEETEEELGDTSEGLICPICGGAAKRLGNCAMVCTSCKQTTRSGCGE